MIVGCNCLPIVGLQRLMGRVNLLQHFHLHNKIVFIVVMKKCSIFVKYHFGFRDYVSPDNYYSGIWHSHNS